MFDSVGPVFSRIGIAEANRSGRVKWTFDDKDVELELSISSCLVWLEVLAASTTCFWMNNGCEMFCNSCLNLGGVLKCGSWGTGIIIVNDDVGAISMLDLTIAFRSITRITNDRVLAPVVAAAADCNGRCQVAHFNVVSGLEEEGDSILVPSSSFQVKCLRDGARSSRRSHENRAF